MKPRPYASTRWTGDPPPTNQQGWTAQVGQPFVPPHLQNLPVSGYAPDELAAKKQAALLILSPLSLWLAGIVVQYATSDYLIGAPLITFLWPVALAAGVGLWVLAGKGVARNVCRRLGQVGWIGVVITAIIYPAAAIYAHGEATPEHQMRSQIANIEVHGRKYNRSWTTTLALQDGTHVSTGVYPAGDYGSVGRCLAVRRLVGPFGFSWLEVGDAAPLPPAPGPGQLHWPVEPVSREDCFSDRPLSELGGKT